MDSSSFLSNSSSFLSKMTEAELIQKIKTLKQIKAREDWALFAKQQIFALREARPLSISVFEILPRLSLSSLKKLSPRLSSRLSSLFEFTPKFRPALALSSLIILALLLGGGLVYFKWQPFSQQIITENQQVSSEKLLASLEDLQVSLEQIVLSLNNLKNIKGSNHALGMTAVIKATAEKGEETVKQLGAMTKDPKTLATLNELGEKFGQVEQMSQGVQGEMIDSLIQDLKQRTLTQEDETRLQKIEEYYQEGKYTEAMLLFQGMGY